MCYRKSLLCAAMMALCVPLCAETITVASLLDRMVDRDALTRFPKVVGKVRLWSSTSRASVSPDKPSWYANWDFNNYLRTETNAQGRVENVLVDAEGPGALVRAWIAGAHHYESVLRIYIDGAQEPVFEGITTNLVGGTGLCGAPLSVGLAPEAEHNRRGLNLYLPITYARRLKVTMEPLYKEIWFYYNFETYTWPQGTEVESMSRDIFESVRAKIAAVNAELSSTSETIPSGETRSFDATLAPGESRAVPFNGPGAIRYIQLSSVSPRDQSVFMWSNEEIQLRDLEIQLKFDGRTTVSLPVGQFFNTGIWSVNPHRTRFTSANDKKLLSCRWVMPFARSAELKIRNRGDRPVIVKDAKVVKGDYAWDSQSMYFAADYVSRPDAPTRKQGLPYDVNYLLRQGKGVVVGSSTIVENSSKEWWGEGDEKIWVDGERYPSIFGTGTEDYYGYAWCWGIPFSHPFLSQPNGDANGSGGVGFGGHSINFRARVLDAIAYTSSIRFDMELWHWADVRLRYDSICWHYVFRAPPIESRRRICYNTAQ